MSIQIYFKTQWQRSIIVALALLLNKTEHSHIQALNEYAKYNLLLQIE